MEVGLFTVGNRALERNDTAEVSDSLYVISRSLFYATPLKDADK